MPARKSADQWFADYGENHQHRINQLLQWCCAPVIFASVLGFFWALPLPAAWQEHLPWLNWALVAMAGAMVFYVRLSPALSAGMFFFLSVCYMVLVMIELFAPWSVGKISAAGFVLAWTGQFIGRILEGGSPSFSRIVVDLIVGPAWLMSRVYQKAGQRY